MNSAAEAALILEQHHCDWKKTSRPNASDRTYPIKNFCNVPGLCILRR